MEPVNCTKAVSKTCYWGCGSQAQESTPLCNYLYYTDKIRPCPTTACTCYEPANGRKKPRIRMSFSGKNGRWW